MYEEVEEINPVVETELDIVNKSIVFFVEELFNFNINRHSYSNFILECVIKKLELMHTDILIQHKDNETYIKYKPLIEQTFEGLNEFYEKRKQR